MTGFCVREMRKEYRGVTRQYAGSAMLFLVAFACLGLIMRVREADYRLRLLLIGLDIVVVLALLGLHLILTDEKNLWLFMLTHVTDVSEELLERSDPIFRCFHRECLVSNLNDMEKKEYVTSVLEYDDVRESMMCEREVGREEGRVEGRVEGREEGREEKTRLLVRNMLAEGLDPAMVAKIADLTEEEVLAMREER